MSKCIEENSFDYEAVKIDQITQLREQSSYGPDSFNCELIKTLISRLQDYAERNRKNGTEMANLLGWSQPKYSRFIWGNGYLSVSNVYCICKVCGDPKLVELIKSLYPAYYTGLSRCKVERKLTNINMETLLSLGSRGYLRYCIHHASTVEADEMPFFSWISGLVLMGRVDEARNILSLIYPDYQCDMVRWSHCDLCNRWMGKQSCKTCKVRGIAKMCRQRGQNNDCPVSNYCFQCQEK